MDIDENINYGLTTLECRVVQWFAMRYSPNIIEYSVPTLHGCHLITHKFDSKAFKEEFPDIDIHKDNPTLLYFNHE